MLPGRASRSLLIIAVAWLVPAISSAAESGRTAEAARGEQIARRDCASCHAVGPRGESPRPPAPPFRELNRRYDVDGLSEALAEGISVGHSAMPEKAYEAKDVQALTAYLKALAGSP